MNIKTLKPEIAEAEQRIYRMFSALKAEVEGSLHVNAYGLLSEGKMDEASQIWERRLSEEPKDWVSLHHLAVIYHCRAYDFARSGEHKKAAEAFTRALTSWAELRKNDEFWEELEHKIIDAFYGDVVSELRRQGTDLQEFMDNFEEYLNKKLPPPLRPNAERVHDFISSSRRFREELPLKLLLSLYDLVIDCDMRDDLSQAGQYMKVILQFGPVSELKIIKEIRDMLNGHFLKRSNLTQVKRLMGREKIPLLEEAIEKAERLVKIDKDNIDANEFVVSVFNTWADEICFPEKDLESVAKIVRRADSYAARLSKLIKNAGQPTIMEKKSLYAFYWSKGLSEHSQGKLKDALKTLELAQSLRGPGDRDLTDVIKNVIESGLGSFGERVFWEKQGRKYGVQLRLPEADDFLQLLQTLRR